MKRVNIKCPYCGAQAYLRPASVIYGGHAVPGAKLYVCGNYPACDSYVAAHPKESLIDSDLFSSNESAIISYIRPIIASYIGEKNTLFENVYRDIDRT